MTQAAPDTVFDAIARLIEPGQREYFYQRMLYFRQLRADDELLRIVEALGFLALIIREAPQAVTREREQLVTLMATTVEAIRTTEQASRAYSKHLEDRLTKLPPDLVKGITASGLVQTLSESVRQQVVQAGLPGTVDALGVVTKDLNHTVRQLQRAATELEACAGMADQARQALGDLSAGLQQATVAGRFAMQEIAETFRWEYRWSLMLICSGAWLLGVFLGLSSASWRASRTQALLPPSAAPTNQATQAGSTGSVSPERHQSHVKKPSAGPASRRPK